MKKLKDLNLGRKLNREEMKSLNGGTAAIGMCVADFQCYHLGAGWNCYKGNSSTGVGTCSHP